MEEDRDVNDWLRKGYLHYLRFLLDDEQFAAVRQLGTPELKSRIKKELER